MPPLRRGLLSLAGALAFSFAFEESNAAPPSSPPAPAQVSLRHHPDGALAGATALAQDHTGFVWVGTHTGLVRWDGVRQRRYAAPPGQPGALPDPHILSLRVDQRGRLWAGTAKGLARYDGAADRFVATAGLAHPHIAALADDGRGGIWVGSGAGLERIDDNLRVYPATSGAPQIAAGALGPGGVQALLRDRSGGLWIGGARGLFHRPSDTRPLRPLGIDASIDALYQDSRGRIWIGTREHGAFVLERADAPARPVLDQGKTLADPVRAFAETDDGRIWIGGAAGAMVEVDAASGAVRRIQLGSGADAQAMLRGRAGQLFVAGAAGVSQLEARTDKPATAFVAVTRALVDGQELAPATFNRPGTVAPLVVPPSARAGGFAIEFAALDFAAPELQRHAHRLEGFDGDWVDFDHGARRVSYANLPAGDYLLRLRVRSASGADAVPLALPVQVLPAWHELVWVRALAALGVAALVAALAQLLLVPMRRRLRELAALADARNAELRATEHRLAETAYVDALTGLPNRRGFIRELERRAAAVEEGGERFTLILIDMDHFKEINFGFGHDAGDALLVTVAQRLRQAMRDTDYIGRMGSDEFAVMVSPSCDDHVTGRICQRIVTSLGRPVEVGERTIEVSASVGAASFSHGPGTLERMYAAADLALGESKTAGRNGWRMNAALAA